MTEERWKLTLSYATDDGIKDCTMFVEELEEIAEIIETGPDWNALVKGQFELNPTRRTGFVTVEESQNL